MSLIANVYHAYSPSAGNSSCNLYNAQTDILGPASAFDVDTVNGIAYPETVNLTTGETASSKVSGFRFRRQGSLYAVCTTSRYTPTTAIYDTGNINNLDTSPVLAFFTQQFSANPGFNIRADVSVSVANSSYPSGVRVYIDGGLWINFKFGTGQSSGSQTFYNSVSSLNIGSLGFGV